MKKKYWRLEKMTIEELVELAVEKILKKRSEQKVVSYKFKGES